MKAAVRALLSTAFVKESFSMDLKLELVPVPVSNTNSTIAFNVVKGGLFLGDAAGNTWSVQHIFDRSEAPASP